MDEIVPALVMTTGRRVHACVAWAERRRRSRGKIGCGGLHVWNSSMQYLATNGKLVSHQLQCGFQQTSSAGAAYVSPARQCRVEARNKITRPWGAMAHRSFLSIAE